LSTPDAAAEPEHDLVEELLIGDGATVRGAGIGATVIDADFKPGGRVRETTLHGRLAAPSGSTSRLRTQR
jgi:hypothetical protein